MEDNFSTKVGEGWFGNDSIYCIYCALYFSYYYIVMYNEIITQLTTMQNQIIRHYISSLDPSHAQSTVGFVILRESYATADLTGGRAQVVM